MIFEWNKSSKPYLRSLVHQKKYQKNWKPMS